MRSSGRSPARSAARRWWLRLELPRCADAWIEPQQREAYERFITAHGVVARQAAMFDDLPHNLETAHALGMTTVLVHGLTDHPEHQAIAGWTELPPHIPHRTDMLAPFLAAIGSALAADKAETVPDTPLRAQFCLT